MLLQLMFLYNGPISYHMRQLRKITTSLGLNFPDLNLEYMVLKGGWLVTSAGLLEMLDNNSPIKVRGSTLQSSYSFKLKFILY